jgi:uncharacterized caspase-like protein
MALFAYALPGAKAQMLSEQAPSTLAADQRFALVIGQSDYRGDPLITGTADASRISEALEQAGFETENGADLEQYLIREKIRTLEEKARRSGAEGTIFVYLCGRVAQINGEDILLPVGAPVDRASDVLLNGFRLNDLVNALKLVPAKARVVVIDAGAPPQQLLSDSNFSPGLAILEAPEGFLIAFNQNPGRPLPEPQPPMGLFSRALLDAMQQPIGSFGDFFALARQRVFEESHNHQMPWDDDKLGSSGFTFFPPKDGTAPSSGVQTRGKNIQIASLSRDQAFQKVIASDSIADYQAFLVKFPNDEATPTIQYNLAVRREAEVWARALKTNTAEGYWTYIEAYPDGGNVEVARERLALLSANSTPPSGFVPLAFGDLPPPLPSGELISSSASFPVEFIPNAPSLNLPPIAPAVVALAATPVANAVGQKLPRANMPSIRPDWAAAPARSMPHSGALRGTAPDFAKPGPRANPPASGPGTYKSLGGVQTPGTSLSGEAHTGTAAGYTTVTPGAGTPNRVEPIRPVPLDKPPTPSEALRHTEPTAGPPKGAPQRPALSPQRSGPQAPPTLPQGHGVEAPHTLSQRGMLQSHPIRSPGHAAPAQRRR